MNPRPLLIAVLLPLSIGTSACAQSALRWKNFSHAAAPAAPVSALPPASASTAPPATAPNIETPDAPTRPLDLQVQALGDDGTASASALPPAEAPTVPQTRPVQPGSTSQRQGLLDASNDYLKRMDKDDDGRVSQDEFIDWMSYSFNARDANHDDVLTPDELPGGKGAPVTRAQFRDNLRQRFLKQDSDRDGYLSAKELASPPR